MARSDGPRSRRGAWVRGRVGRRRVLDAAAARCHESSAVIALRPHPSTPEPAFTVSAFAERAAEHDLRLRYLVDGALDRLRLPAPGTVRRGDRLWEHTCTEAFVAAEGASEYVELNFSPSREWAAYAFTSYRAGEPLASARLAPRIDVRRERGTIAFDVCVALGDLASAYPDAVLRVGLSVVTETTDGRHAYWALRHPTSDRPDFHHPDAWALRLEPPA
jgi:hypothetical protein